MIINDQIKFKVAEKPVARSGARETTIVPMMAEVIRRDDGTYLLRPRLVDSELDSWIAPKKAAQIIGINERSIYRLIDAERPFLVHKRPLKGRFLVSLNSVQIYVRATSDPDFWDDSLQQKTLTDSVQKRLKQMREPLDSKENFLLIQKPDQQKGH